MSSDQKSGAGLCKHRALRQLAALETSTGLTLLSDVNGQPFVVNLLLLVQPLNAFLLLFQQTSF